jgi:hypothetical protein
MAKTKIMCRFQVSAAVSHLDVQLAIFPHAQSPSSLSSSRLKNWHHLRWMSGYLSTSLAVFNKHNFVRGSDISFKLVADAFAFCQAALFALIHELQADKTLASQGDTLIYYL